jgi:hypothetical protein
LLSFEAICETPDQLRCCSCITCRSLNVEKHADLECRYLPHPVGKRLKHVLPLIDGIPSDQNGPSGVSKEFPNDNAGVAIGSDSVWPSGYEIHYAPRKKAASTIAHNQFEHRCYLLGSHSQGSQGFDASCSIIRELTGNQSL